MAKSVVEKLLIGPDAAIWTSDPECLELIGPLPVGARPVGAPGDATTALVLAPDEASVRAVLKAHGATLAQPGALWVLYPKGNRTDINRDGLWPILGELGLRPIGQVAVDDVWSAIRFRPLKEGEAQFTGGTR